LNLYKTIIVIFCCWICSEAVAQSHTYNNREHTKNLPKFEKRRIHFGFLIGINSNNFIVTRKNPPLINNDSLLAINPSSSTGFNLGIISDLHLSDFFNLRFTPNLAFTSRTLSYTYQTFDGPKVFQKDIESTLINLPLNLKYKSVRLNNFSAYFIGGAAYTIDLASNVNADNLSTNLSDIIVKLKRDDIVAEIGFGTEFYLQYFKFGIELKMSYGLINILHDDGTQLSTPIDKLRSKMLLLSFTFEG